MKQGIRQVLLGAALVATAAGAQGTTGQGSQGTQAQQQITIQPGTGGAGQGAMSSQQWLQNFQQANDMEIQLSQLASQRASSPQVKQLAQTMIRDHQQANQQLRQMAAQANISLPSTQTGVGGGGQAGTGQGGAGQPGATQPMSQPGMGQPGTSQPGMTQPGMAQGGAGQQMGGQAGQMSPQQQQQALMQLYQGNQQLLAGLQGPAFDRAFLASTLMSHDMELDQFQRAQQERGSPAANYAQQTAPTVRMHRDQAYSLLGQMAPSTSARTGSTGR